MNKIFQSVYEFLKWLSRVTGFTYHEINIIVYYILIPAFFFYLISRKLKNYYIVITFLLFVFISLFFIDDFKLFSDYLFQKSVNFLNLFQHMGLNYMQASVIICVFIPLIFIFFLLLFKKKKA